MMNGVVGADLDPPVWMMWVMAWIAWIVRIVRIVWMFVSMFAYVRSVISVGCVIYVYVCVVCCAVCCAVYVADWHEYNAPYLFHHLRAHNYLNHISIISQSPHTAYRSQYFIALWAINSRIKTNNPCMTLTQIGDRCRCPKAWITRPHCR